MDGEGGGVRPRGGQGARGVWCHQVSKDGVSGVGHTLYRVFVDILTIVKEIISMHLFPQTGFDKLHQCGNPKKMNEK